VKVRALQRQVPSLLLFAALLVIWQALPPLFGIREYLLPGPVAVVRAA
jgi:ABC-type nitrate/sulfonate/bicarbonate transport system permease component